MACDRNRGVEEGVFQFHLRHLFVLVLLNAIYFALVRSAGEFVAALVIGVFVLTALVTLLRIEDLLHGAVIGTCAAGAILVCAGLAFGPVPTWLFVIGCVAYPALGYTLGILCAAHRQLHSG